MANTHPNDEQTNMLYWDSRCSNHVIENKNWFTKLDESIKKLIRFADGLHVTSSGKVVVVRRDG